MIEPDKNAKKKGKGFAVAAAIFFSAAIWLAFLGVYLYRAMLRSCLKTQDSARETHESYEKKQSYFDFDCFFCAIRVFRGQKNSFQTASKLQTAVECRSGRRYDFIFPDAFAVCRRRFLLFRVACKSDYLLVQIVFKNELNDSF